LATPRSAFPVTADPLVREARGSGLPGRRRRVPGKHLWSYQMVTPATFGWSGRRRGTTPSSRLPRPSCPSLSSWRPPPQPRCRRAAVGTPAAAHLQEPQPPACTCGNPGQLGRLELQPSGEGHLGEARDENTVEP
jgi:hypothetical protein